jgi:hypothetical protein
MNPVGFPVFARHSFGAGRVCLDCNQSVYFNISSTAFADREYIFS